MDRVYGKRVFVKQLNKTHLSKNLRLETNKETGVMSVYLDMANNTIIVGKYFISKGYGIIY